MLYFFIKRVSVKIIKRCHTSYFYQNSFFPLIIRNKTDISAITSKMCIIHPALYPMNPIAQKTTNISAMT